MQTSNDARSHSNSDRSSEMLNSKRTLQYTSIVGFALTYGDLQKHTYKITDTHKIIRPPAWWITGKDRLERIDVVATHTTVRWSPTLLMRRPVLSWLSKKNASRPPPHPHTPQARTSPRWPDTIVASGSVVAG